MIDPFVQAIADAAAAGKTLPRLALLVKGVVIEGNPATYHEYAAFVRKNGRAYPAPIPDEIDSLLSLFDPAPPAALYLMDAAIDGAKAGAWCVLLTTVDGVRLIKP
jgi:hypothetical protein